MKFDELPLDSAILDGVTAVGFEQCTPVQAETIPRVLEGRDVMVQSQTGTGKTAAFLLPAFQLLLHHEKFQGSTAIVIAPTRELAVQIKEESDMLAANLPIRTEVFHGGVGYEQQQRALSEGVNIVVGTPGRIIDLNQSGYMDMRTNAIVIIDEADRLLDMGFYPDLRKMLRRMRPKEERVNMLFSATLGTKARNIAWEHMNSPVEIEVKPEQITVDTVQQELYHVASGEKMSLLLGLLERDQPRTAIIFTNTKRAAEEVSRRLAMNGFPTDFIIGDLPQRKRLAIIRKLKAGEAEFLVATDVAARGLHIDNLEMVINYDVPEDPEAYVHRIGRTARAGESGKAVMLACERYVFGLDSVEHFIGQKIPVGASSPDLYAEDASAGKRVRLEATGRDADRDRGRDRGRDRDRGPRRRVGGERGTRDKRDGERSRERVHAESRGDSASLDRKKSEKRGDRRGEKRGSRRRGGEQFEGAPRSGDSLEQRLAYYRSKYGEDFQPTDEMLANMGETRRKSASASQGDRSGRSRRGRAGEKRSGERRSGEKRSGEKRSGERSKEVPAGGHDPDRQRSSTESVSVEKKRSVIERLKGLFRT